MSVREQRELLFIEFMCEKLDSQVYVDPNILSRLTATVLTLGNWWRLTSAQNFAGPWVQSSHAMVMEDWMSTSSRMNFPSSMEGTTSFALVDKSPPVAAVNGSLAKSITSVGRGSPSNRPTKFSFNLAINSFIVSAICAGLWDAVVECRKMQHSACGQVSCKKVQFDLECTRLLHKFSDSFVSAL